MAYAKCGHADGSAVAGAIWLPVLSPERAELIGRDYLTTLRDLEKLSAALVQTERALTEASSFGGETGQSRSHADTYDFDEPWAADFNREVRGAQRSGIGDDAWRNDATAHSF